MVRSGAGSVNAPRAGKPQRARIRWYASSAAARDCARSTIGRAQGVPSMPAAAWSTGRSVYGACSAAAGTRASSGNQRRT